MAPEQSVGFTPKDPDPDNFIVLDPQIMKALQWAERRLPCAGCKSKGAEHTPLCVLIYRITVNRGAKGRVVLLDPNK